MIKNAKHNLAPAGFFIACNLEMAMNFPDPVDEAAECEQLMIEIALANRKHPEMVWCLPMPAITAKRRCQQDASVMRIAEAITSVLSAPSSTAG